MTDICCHLCSFSVSITLSQQGGRASAPGIQFHRSCTAPHFLRCRQGTVHTILSERHNIPNLAWGWGKTAGVPQHEPGTLELSSQGPWSPLDTKTYMDILCTYFLDGTRGLQSARWHRPRMHAEIIFHLEEAPLRLYHPVRIFLPSKLRNFKGRDNKLHAWGHLVELSLNYNGGRIQSMYRVATGHKRASRHYTVLRKKCSHLR